MSITRVSRRIGDKEIIIETGRMAKQAHGAVTVQCGETIALTTAVSNYAIDESRDFFPLTVDYREKTYAAGKIPGGYFKREGRPTERETLVSRLIDRPIRSAFNKDYTNETQIISTVISSDSQNLPDIVSMIGASAALIVSDIPFMEPVGAVRVGMIGDNYVINPTLEELDKSSMDIIIAGTRDRIVMIEAGASEIPEEHCIDAIMHGMKFIAEICDLQDELRQKAGKPKREIIKKEISTGVQDKVASIARGEFGAIFDLGSKEEREAALTKFYEEKVLGQFDAEAEDFDANAVKAAFGKVEKEYVREMILNQNKRPDGRSTREIRAITCEVGVLPRTHGSSIFTRGQTQSLCVTTLGTGDDEQKIDALEGDIIKRFMLHYNFPPFSVGEVGRFGGTGRREIGHGALAERALEAVMPDEEEFPYVVRLVSDILESNGSSSMATVCGGTLALMDAGVPLKAPVAGIAIGLITGEANKWKVLTDIAGIEDHLGDMDFKVAGTREGVTAIQMDLKICGISEDILREAFDQAKEARMKILDIIEQAIAAPRTELSVHAPRITAIEINPEKIGALIGPGGKMIRSICEETGVKIDIDDSGRVMIASTDAVASERALERIRGVVAEAEIGAVYEGTVKKLMAFGAFIEILPGQEGLCHVSEVSETYVKDVTEYLRVGDVVPVKVVGMENGKVSLSIKQAKEGGMPPLPPDVKRDVIAPSAPRGGGRDRGRSRR